MVLVQKWPFFQLFFLGNIGQENVFYDILEQKNVFLSFKNKKSKKSKNWHFSKGFPMVLVQKWQFFQVFFLGNTGRENVCFDILKRKNVFLSYKNKKSKKSKNGHFSKGVNPWFWSKMAIFPTFFFGNIAQQNVFYDILKEKNAFLGYKNKQFKKSKNWHFSLVLVQYRAGKCLLRYSTAKKRFSRLSKQEVQKVEKLTFFKRG